MFAPHINEIQHMANLTVNQVLAKAAKFEKSGNFKKAAETYSIVLKSGAKNDNARVGFLRSVGKFSKPPSNKAEFQNHINSTAKLLERGNYTAAERQLGPLLKTFPNNVLLMNMNGVANLGLNRPKIAAEALRIALALKPDYADAHQNLGLALQQLGKPEAALNSFEQAVKFKPDFAKAYDNIGSMHQFFGQFEEAIEFHRKSIELDPNSLESRRNAAVAYRKLAFYPEALAEYRWIIDAGEDSAQNYHGMSTILRKLENPSAALEASQKALEKDPTFVRAHLERGNCFRLMGDKDEAELCYRKAIELDPNSGFAYFNLASVTKLKISDHEVDILHQMVEDESYPADELSLVNFTLAYAYENSADLETSFVYLKKANALRKAHMDYSIQSDRELFDRLKSNAKAFSNDGLSENLTSIEHSPIFILGMPRSGTTLTEQIISAHPSVSGCGELNFGPQFGMKVARGDVEISPKTIADFRESYSNAVRSLSPQTDIITDKLPHNFRLIGLLATAFPEAKFVHTKRDPGAVCWSNFHLSFGSNGLGYSYDLDDVVEYFGMYQDIVGLWNDVFGDRIYNLDYELLTSDQENQTRKLVEFLEIGWDDACLSPEKNERKVVTASHSQVKKSVYKGSSQKWRRFEPYLDGAFDNLSW